MDTSEHAIFYMNMNAMSGATMVCSSPAVTFVTDILGTHSVIICFFPAASYLQVHTPSHPFCFPSSRMCFTSHIVHARYTGGEEHQASRGKVRLYNYTLGGGGYSVSELGAMATRYSPAPPLLYLVRLRAGGVSKI